MQMLRIAGIFTMRVPNGWTAKEDDDGRIVLSQAENAWLHISVYGRNAGPLHEGEAREAFDGFLRTMPIDTDPKIHLHKRRSEQRAVARVDTPDVVPDKRIEWILAIILWPDQMLMCTSCGKPGDPTLSTVERMLATITPDGHFLTSLLRR